MNFYEKLNPLSKDLEYVDIQSFEKNPSNARSRIS